MLNYERFRGFTDADSSEITYSVNPDTQIGGYKSEKKRTYTDKIGNKKTS